MRTNVATVLLLMLALILSNLVSLGIVHQTGQDGNGSSPTNDTKPGISSTLGKNDPKGPALGQASLVGTVDVGQLSGLKTTSSRASDSIPQGATVEASASLGPRARLSPSVTGSANPGPSSVTLLTGFEGLSQGAGDPPDVVLAAGPNHVFQMVNNIGEIYSKQGTPIKNLVLGSFFLIGGGTSDPKVLYDASSQRWFASIMDTGLKRVVLAVSASNDPTATWNIYSLSPGSSRCTDQPLIGVSDDKFVVSGNIFSSNCPLTTSNTGFLGAQYWVLNKLEMVAGLRSVDFVSFGPDPTTESAFPSQSLSSTTSVYMVSAGVNASFDSGATSPTSNAIQLFTITGVPPGTVTVATRTFPTLITRPPMASQPGTTVLLQTDDARVQDAVWYQGNLWLSLNDACTPPGDIQARSCVHLIQLDTAVFRIKQDIDYGNNAQYFFYPALSIDRSGDLGVIYGYSSASNSTCCFASLAVTGQGISDPPNTLAPSQTIRRGSGIVSSNRYGDYFGAGRDPSDPTIIWTAGEYATGIATFVESLRLTSLSISPSSTYLSIPTGSSATTTITFTSIGGFTGKVSLTTSIAPTGPTVSITPSTITVSNSSTQTSMLKISASATTPAGAYNVTLTANAGGGSRFLSLPVRVGPDFTISTSPASLSFRAGSSATSLVTVTSLNNFAGPVFLSVSIWAPGPAVSLNSTSVNLALGGTRSSQLTASTSFGVAAGNYAVTVNGTAGSITHFQIITAGVVDFGVSSAPAALNIGAGTSGVSNVTMTSINSIATLVRLTVSSTGPSVSVNPTTVSVPARGLGNSTVTIFVPGTFAPGSVYTITVTGANGTLSHSASITVTIVGVVCIADISSPGPCPGASGWNFNGPYTSPKTQLKVGVFVSDSAGFNLFQVTVVSDSTKLFLVSVDTSGSILGSSATYFNCIRRTCASSGPQDNFNTVSVSGFTGSSTPNPTTGLLFTLTFNITSVTSTLPIGFQTGCSNGSVLGASTCVSLMLGGSVIPEVAAATSTFSSAGNPPFVALSASPSSLGPTPANTGATSIVTAMSQNGFPKSLDPGIVTFTTQGVGVGVSMNSSSVTLTPGSSSSITLTLTGSSAGVSLVTVFGTYTVTNSTTGMASTLSATLTVSITVTDFKLSASPTSVSFNAGSTNTSTITITSLGGFAGTVTLSASSFPTGVSVTFNPTSVTLTAGGNATSTATIGASTANNYSVNMIGGNSNDIRAVRLTVTVKFADFSISENPTSQIIPAGSERQTTITASSLGAFYGTVNLVATPSLGAVSCWFTTLTNSAPVNVPTSGKGYEYMTCTGGPAGNYTVTTKGTSGSLNHSVILNVTITDFSMSGPASVSFPTGASTGGSINLASLFGFSGTVNLAVSTPTTVSVSCPSNTSLISGSVTGAACTFNSSTPGQYTVTITGSFTCTDCYYNGKISHSVTITINVGDFSISLSPTSASIPKGFGSSTSSTISLNSLYSFSGTVTLTAQLSPVTNNSPSISLNPTSSTLAANGTVTSQLTITANSSTTKGTYTITVTATSGTIVHTATFTVTIT